MDSFKVLIDYITIVDGGTHDKPAGPDTINTGHIAAAVFDDRSEGNFPICRGDTPYFTYSGGESLAKRNFMTLEVGVGLWVAARAGEDSRNQENR